MSPPIDKESTQGEQNDYYPVGENKKKPESNGQTDNDSFEVKDDDSSDTEKDITEDFTDEDTQEKLEDCSHIEMRKMNFPFDIVILFISFIVIFKTYIYTLETVLDITIPFTFLLTGLIVAGSLVSVIYIMLYLEKRCVSLTMRH